MTNSRWYSGSATLDPTRDVLPGGNVYPTDGSSIGVMATGGGGSRQLTSTGADGSAAPVAVMDGPIPGVDVGTGNPIIGFAVVACLMLVAWWAAHELGDDSDFANIRASFFNAVIIAVVATAGVPLVKIALIKLEDMGVPGADHAASWALAA